jgi:transposase-like protein
VTVYSETFKNKLVARMLMPNPRPMATLARETGVTEPTLYRWRNEATLRGMSTDRPDDFDKSAAPAKPPHAWTPEDKLAVVLEAAAIPEAELGAFLRRKGVHEAQLAEWRKQVTEGAVAALRGPSGRDRKAAHVEAKRVRELERELARKDKALAEAAALLVLKKKVQAIWGDEDDDTTPENDE